MRKTCLISGLFLGLAFLAFLAAPRIFVDSAFAQEKYSSERLANMYKDYLVSEGYRPQIKEEKGEKFVVFKHESRVYIIDANANDPQFFNLIYLAFWEVKPNERSRVLEAINHVNAETKSVKIFLVDNSVHAVIEAVTPKVGDFELIFKRSLNQIRLGVAAFREKMALKGF